MLNNYPFLRLCVLLIAGMNVMHAQIVSKYIVIDQFGYLPEEVKIAVIRDPITGSDAAESFTPGNNYAVVNLAGQQVYKGSPRVWGGGSEDASSGDKAWWFDFSTVKTPGDYYILDVANNVKSYTFQINKSIYNNVLKQAVRTFFYQRAGFAKDATYAGEAWADAASHLQDSKARAYNDMGNAATEKDVSGGWYDAGDYNKYTNWTSSYVVQMMLAYLEKPEAWGDDYNLPESGNKIPDLLDEAKWGIDHLLRMQQKNGSVLSIASLSHASPPSKATGTTYYGAINTSSAHSVAGAFALASTVYRKLGMTVYADTLLKRAKAAWNWSGANPNVVWNNNDPNFGSKGIGAGQQEQSDYDRKIGRIKAAIFLFAATGEATYRSYVDANFRTAHLLEWTSAYPFEGEAQDALLYYTTLTTATSATKKAILNAYASGMEGEHNLGAYVSETDPYRAHLKDYTWGSNNIKSIQGTMFHNMISYGVDPTQEEDARNAALGYLHYIHGVNPLSFVYLSNMYAHGAENGVNEFYHSWFTDKSAKWDRVGTSTYGPAPGFLVGGANPAYDWADCCLGDCASLCKGESITPPKGQPKQKSYKDFNTNWPINSWSVTENSNGYQISYIRLLSKFIDYQLATGLEHEETAQTAVVELFPNPTTGSVWIQSKNDKPSRIAILDMNGNALKTYSTEKVAFEINMTELPAGSYLVKIMYGDQVVVKPLVKL